MFQYIQFLATAVLVFGVRFGTVNFLNAQIFYDDFEYDVEREASNIERMFQSHGWIGVKANNSNYGRGAGYIYTKYDTTLNSRVLVLEALPSTAQPRGYLSIASPVISLSVGRKYELPPE